MRREEGGGKREEGGGNRAEGRKEAICNPGAPIRMMPVNYVPWPDILCSLEANQKGMGLPNSRG